MQVTLLAPMYRPPTLPSRLAVRVGGLEDLSPDFNKARLLAGSFFLLFSVACGPPGKLLTRTPGRATRRARRPALKRADG